MYGQPSHVNNRWGLDGVKPERREHALKYYYGDGVESPLKFNYLEYLRLIVEFSASVLASQTKVEADYNGARRKKELAKTELQHLNTLLRFVESTLDTAASKISAPIAVECIGTLRALNRKAIERAEQDFRSNLSRNLEGIQETVDRERANNERRLEKVLLRYDIPTSQHWIGMRPFDDTGYEIALTTFSDMGVNAEILLSIPEGHRLAHPVRVDSIDPDLAINMAQNGGLGLKNFKTRSKKLAKEYVVSLSNDEGGVVLALRNSFPDGPSGYDIVFNESRVAVTRISKQQLEEPFVADSDETARLLALMRTLLGSLGELSHHRRVLKSAFFEGIPLREHKDPTKLVYRLLKQAGPIVREIAAHTLSPRELILKRVIGGDRREEVFASIPEMQKLYADLTDRQKKLFLPLGFERRSSAPAHSPVPSAPPTDSGFDLDIDLDDLSELTDSSPELDIEMEELTDPLLSDIGTDDEVVDLPTLALSQRAPRPASSIPPSVRRSPSSATPPPIPKPSAPSPSASEPDEPAPDEPESAEPESAEPESDEPESDEPESAEPAPDEPESAEPAPDEPESAEPESVEPESAEPESAEPESVEPESAEPESVEPESAEPAPVEPEPNDEEKEPSRDV